MEKTLLVVKPKNGVHFIAQGYFKEQESAKRGDSNMERGLADGYAVLDIVGKRVINDKNLSSFEILKLEKEFMAK